MPENPNRVPAIVSAMVEGGLSALTTAELHCLKAAIDSGAAVWLKLHDALSSFASGLVHLASIEPAKEPPAQVVDTDDHGLRRYLGEVN
jgi:hypothetical protein